MGYSIYYSRAFIRVGDQYVPLVSSGASNGAERIGGRWVLERDWGVLNWKRQNRVLFSAQEIREIAKDYEQNNQENGMSFKARGKPFAHGEFERWIVGGMNRARTIEEYRSDGNTIQAVDFPNGATARWRRQPVATDGELLAIISQLSDGRDFDIVFKDREIKRPTARKEIRNANGAAMNESTPFAAIFGVTNAVPDASRQEAAKPSVLGQIAEAREEQRRARSEGLEPPSSGVEKPKRDKARKSHGEVL